MSATALSAPGSKARRIQDSLLALLAEHEAQESGLPTRARGLSNTDAMREALQEWISRDSSEPAPPAGGTGSQG